MTGNGLIATQLKSLIRGKHSSIHIGFNDECAPNYMTVEEWINEGHDDNEWVSEGERQKAIDTNSMWTIQWYPDTPVGFYCVAASTFEAALAFAISEHEKGAT